MAPAPRTRVGFRRDGVDFGPLARRRRDDVRPGPRQAERHRAAEPAPGAGHDRHLAG